MSQTDGPANDERGQSGAPGFFADVNRLRDDRAGASASEAEVVARARAAAQRAIEAIRQMSVEYAAKLAQVVQGKPATWIDEHRSGPNTMTLVEDRLAAYRAPTPRRTLFGRAKADDRPKVAVWRVPLGSSSSPDDDWWVDGSGAWFISAGPGCIAPVAAPSLVGLKRAIDGDYDEYFGLVMTMVDNDSSQVAVFDSGERLSKSDVDTDDLEQRIQEVVDGVQLSMGTEIARLVSCE